MGARKKRPWCVELSGIAPFKGRAATRQSAMNMVDKPYIYGLVRLRNVATGEEWSRVRGTWFREIEPGVEPAARGANDADRGAEPTAAKPRRAGPRRVRDPASGEVIVVDTGVEP